MLTASTLAAERKGAGRSLPQRFGMKRLAPLNPYRGRVPAQASARSQNDLTGSGLGIKQAAAFGFGPAWSSARTLRPPMSAMLQSGFGLAQASARTTANSLAFVMMSGFGLAQASARTSLRSTAPAPGSGFGLAQASARTRGNTKTGNYGPGLASRRLLLVACFSH